jgi:predicted nucleic acid-binding protein
MRQADLFLTGQRDLLVMRSLNYRDLHQEGNRLPVAQVDLFLTGQRDLLVMRSLNYRDLHKAHQEGNRLVQQGSLAH